ncbi:MAG: hypothetical protein ABSH38_08795 [Verrucomicrobiota bacterium]
MNKDKTGAPSPARKPLSNSYWDTLSEEEKELVQSVLRKPGVSLREARGLVPPMRDGEGKEIGPPAVGTLSRISQELRTEEMLLEIEADTELAKVICGKLRSGALRSQVQERLLDEIMEVIGEEVRHKSLRRMDPAIRTASARLLLKRADQRRADRRQKFLEARARRIEAGPTRPHLTEEDKQRRLKELLEIA